REPLHVLLKPLELLRAEVAKAAGFQVDYVDEANEVDAVAIEAVVAGPARARTIARQIGPAVLLVEQVVLAGHIEHRNADLPDDLLGVVELLLLREVADVAGVDQEGRPDGHRPD